VSDHIPDLTKMISDTPISDSTPHNVGDLAMVCRRLERKLAATRKYLSEVSERIKRLEEAGDAIMKSLSCGCPHGDSVFNCHTCTNSWDAWRKAKEAKL
jgi:hypothetical protein